ncbi:MAG: hypothetical protein GKR87_10250 [Kiritimatiellae bacterium]|nr:hypothetical protein [Kiritimatiellia bacterium]
MNKKHGRIVHAIYCRTWLTVLRRPVVLTFSLVQPMMWMLFFGFLFHRYSVDEFKDQLSYLDFLVPGICAMTVLFGASQSGISLIRDMQTQFLNRIIFSPVSLQWILPGKILADVSRLIIQAMIVGIIGTFLGARLHFDVCSFLATLIAGGLFATAFCSLSCWIAVKTKPRKSMAVFIHIVNMPMLFTSTAFVPNKHMPSWLASIAQWNPLTQAIEVCRNALLLGETTLTPLTLIYLALPAVLLFMLTSRALRKARNHNV